MFCSEALKGLKPGRFSAIEIFIKKEYWEYRLFKCNKAKVCNEGNYKLSRNCIKYQKLAILLEFNKITIIDD